MTHRPPESVWAEFVAWPLACPTAVLDGSAMVRPRRLHATLRQRAMHLGHPDLADTLANTWTRTPDPIALLQQHAGKLLQPISDHCVLRSGATAPTRALLRWRWVSLALPVSVLSVAAAASPITRVRLLDAGLAPAGPVAHLHQHKGASLDFESLWSELMRSTEHAGCVTCPPEGITGSSWRDLVQCAAITRALLVARWRHGDRSAPGGFLDDVVRYLAFPNKAPARPDSLAMGQQLYRMFRRKGSFDGILGDHVEAHFLHHGLFHTRAGSWERHLFTQVLRVKTLLHRRLVMDPTTTSLGTFTHAFDTMRAYARDLRTPDPLRFGFEAPGLEVRVNEVRTAPPEQIGDLIRSCTSTRGVAAPGRSSDREWGWTLHFIRNLADISSTCPKRRKKSLHHRLRAQARAHRKQSRALMQCIDTWPQTLAVIRALDIASAENNGPLFLVAPYLRMVRDTSDAVARRERDPRLQGLRMTLHAGEDFRHPLAGLRRVHEGVAWRLLRRGDRLGHGLVLGLDLKRHVARAPRTWVPLWSRALDLSWALAAVARFRLDVSIGDVERLRQDLGRAARGLGMDDLEHLHAAVGHPEAIHHLDLDPIAGTGPSGLAGRFVSPEVLEHWNTPVEVDIQAELPLMEKLQRALLDLLSEHRISIELNPSSNQIIYGMQEPLQQPLFALSDPGAGGPDITISTDDPISFASTLADEYAYAWAALVETNNLSPREATAWLERVAATSMRVRFTVPASADLTALPVPGLGRPAWKTPYPPTSR